MKSSDSLQKLLYAVVGLLGLGLLGIIISAVYGRAEQEHRYIVSVIFYIGLGLGAIGFLGLAAIMYFKFKQRSQLETNND